MKYSLRARIVALGKRNRDVIAELKNRGIYASDSKFSNAITGANVEPVSLKIVEVTEKILDEWENEVQKGVTHGTPKFSR